MSLTRHRCQLLKAPPCNHRTSWDDVRAHLLGVSRVFARDTPVGQPILIIGCIFPFVITFNVADKDAALTAVDYSGPRGAYNDDGAATMSTTLLLETPVFVTWRRRDPKMPPLKPWQCRRVLGTLSTRSGRYESESLDLTILTVGFHKSTHGNFAVEFPGSCDSDLWIASPVFTR